MAIYYAQEIFERTSARASALRNEAGALLLSCSGGNMTRLGGEDWEPPLALELTGVHARHQEGWHDYMGVYKLESREVNGKPCWRHAERSDLWLAFDGVGCGPRSPPCPPFAQCWPRWLCVAARRRQMRWVARGIRAVAGG
jgi:hypothetical protein